MSVIVDHFASAEFGRKKDKVAWEVWNADAGKFPRKSDGPDWAEEFFRNHENSDFFTGIRKGKKPPVEDDEVVPPPGQTKSADGTNDGNGSGSELRMNDFLTGKHKSVNQAQALAMLAVSKTSPVPPSSSRDSTGTAAEELPRASTPASSSSSLPKPQFSIVMKRDMDNGSVVSSQVFIDREKLYTTTIKDVVKVSIQEDKGSGVFALSNTDNEIVMRCGGGEWRLKSGAAGEKKIGWIADNHGSGDKVLFLTVAEVVPQASAATLSDLFGASSDED